MKNLWIQFNNWVDKLNGQWRALPVKKQHRYTLLLFTGYALLSVFIILKACNDVGNSDNKMKIEHIENPIIQQPKSLISPQDSISKIIKKKIYEK